MKIQITAPSGVTLLTEKTYCPENIDVIPSLQDKTVTPGEAQTVTPDTGYAGLSSVNVEAVDTEPGAATPSAAAQVITPSAGKFFDQFTVNAAPLDEAQTVTAGTSAKTVSPTGSNIGIKSVTVNPTPSETKSVTLTVPGETVTVTPDSGKLLSSVSVSQNLQAKIVTPTTSQQVINPDSGFCGLGIVSIDPIPTETKTVIAGTSATTVTPTNGKFLTSVTVNPTPSEEKTVEITSSGNTDIVPSDGKLLSKVTVTPVLQSDKPAYASDTTQFITPDAGYAGLGSVELMAAPLQDITITQATDISQELNPDIGYYGFGKITVPQLTGDEKTVTITENGTTTVNYSDPKLMSKVTITTSVPAIVDVATAAEMNAKLVAGNVGNVYRFTGTTDDTYTNGDLYEVVSE